MRCDQVFRPSAGEIAATTDAARGQTSLLAVSSLALAIVGSIGIVIFVSLCYMEYPIKVFSWDLFAALGTPWFCYPILYVLPVVLGTQARSRIKASPARSAGLGLARAGAVLGACNTVLGFVVYIVVFFAQLPGPFSDDGQWPGVTRVRAEMRSLARAIEDYYVDHSMYPAWGAGADGPGGTVTYNYSLAPRAKADEPRRSWYFTRKTNGRLVWYEKIPNPNHPADQPNFALNGQAPDRRFATLTTPKAYTPSYPTDYFSAPRGATFAYWSTFPGQKDPSGRIVGKDSPTGGVGWILVSPGPDCKHDILPDDWDVYDPRVAQPSKRLLAGTNKRGHAFTYDPTNGSISDGDIWRVKQ